MRQNETLGEGWLGFQSKLWGGGDGLGVNQNCGGRGGLGVNQKCGERGGHG